MAMAGIPYSDDSLAADTVPECRTSTERFGPWFIPEIHKAGAISGAHA